MAAIDRSYSLNVPSLATWLKSDQMCGTLAQNIKVPPFGALCMGLVYEHECHDPGHCVWPSVGVCNPKLWVIGAKFEVLVPYFVFILSRAQFSTKLAEILHEVS